ncbi:wax ester/triacylglycerol synthase domain-containing protein [Actinophytocola oryzae]|uniref:diacylglycerol O-acyltransferase n=1 Tax=Actinophytocola oryzae TaxID=502181 RepID=A0A4R7W2E6_9PSEU|nr:wax ester/triacylglycerol synthase domain-containing protein [Actinophytocola oryzae]TDV56188.1 diacylglycerol O-acyltransferase [Actinophytocola oryzae]
MSAGRLSPTDFSFLAYEKAHRSVAAEIGAVLVFDGVAPHVDELREHVGGRLSLLPGLNRVLSTGRARLLRPRWLPAGEPDLEFHVRERVLARGSGEVGLRGAVDDLLTARLDHDRPMWELWLLRGHCADRFAVVYKVHHSVHDGVALTEVVRRLFTEAPERPVDPPRTNAPRGAARGLLSVGADLFRPARRSPLTGRHSGRRGLVWGSAPLDLLRTAAGTGRTVNDVFLAALADALRTWAAAWATDPPPNRLQALVPVSIRAPHEHGSLGNRLAAVRIPLPMTGSGPARALDEIARDTARAKDHGRAAAAALVAGSAHALPAAFVRGMGELSWNPHVVNLIASNMRGPDEPLSLAGRPLAEFVVVNFTPADHLVSVTLLSHLGRVFVAFAGDTALPGFAELPDRWRAALDALAQTRTPVSHTPKEGPRP